MSDPKPFDLPSFIAFVASKDAGEWYNSLDADCCALAQFGFPGASDDDMKGVPEVVYAKAVAVETFGQLLQRLEALS